MAPGLVIQDNAKQYNGRVTMFVVLSCMVAASGGLIYGYDTGVSGGVTSMDTFLKKFFPEVYRKMNEDTELSNYCKFDSQLLTSFTSSLYISGLLSSFLASFITREFGRKTSMIVGGVAYVLGAALGGAAYNVYMLLFGRLLLGVGLGFTNQSVPMYVAEMAPSKYRGAFGTAFQISVSIGYNSATLINYGTVRIKGDWGWRISVALVGVPALIFALGACFLPETPNGIVEHTNDHENAKNLLRRIRGVEDVNDEFDDLVEASYASISVKHPFKNIMQRKYRPQLVMSVAIPFFQQMSGINVISFYAPILFRTIGSGESSSLLSTSFTGFVGSLFVIIAVLLVDKAGRRSLLLIGGVLMLISQVFIGGIMAAKLGDQGEMDIGYSLTVLILISVYISGFGFSWGPLGWVVTSEIFPLEVRAAGQSIVVAVGLFLTYVIAQTFLFMLCHLKSGIFFFFGVWVVLMTLFVYFFLPETKGIPIEKMDKIWEEHFFWKRFVDKSDVNENEGAQTRLLNSNM